MKQTNSLREAVAAAFGEGARIVDRAPVYGGDINRSWRLSLSDGSAAFLKTNAAKNLPFFAAEAVGLKALRSANAIGVPEAQAIGTDVGEGTSFMLMEYLDAAPRIAGYWETFGRELAKLHRADCRGLTGSDRPFGFASDNFIGATPQKNAPGASWIAFFRECRLLPQMRMADGYFDAKVRKQCTKLLDHLDDHLTEPEFPSLIHGDLWSGNAVCGPDGKAWILDPAAYVGHHEAELAMTELFGGYPATFYRAYGEVNPIDGGYRDRRELYNLYHLLNHLNLFGGSYRTAVQSVLNRYA